MQRNLLPMALLIVLSLLMIGCAGVLTPRIPTAPKDTHSYQPQTVLEEGTVIGHLGGPSSATVSEPVTLSVWAYAGPSGCDGLGTTSVVVDHATRSATIQATATHRVGTDVQCPQIYVGYMRATVSFTPESTGTYTIAAQPYELKSPNDLSLRLGPGVVPAGTLSLEVVAASSSVLPDGNNDDSGAK